MTINQTLEKLLNRYLSLDSESKNRLAALEGKKIKIELLAISHSFNWLIKEGKISVLEDAVELPDVVIKGTPLSLVHMSWDKQNRKEFFKEKVSLEGDLELGQQIIDLFDEMEIDWEECLSTRIGDVPAHQLGRLMRSVGDIAKRVKDSLIQNVNEYVHEEILLFPPHQALQDFFHEIDLLRMDADRLEARVKRLQSYSLTGEEFL